MQRMNPEVDHYVLPRTAAELRGAVTRAKSLVNRRAALASASVLVPIPGFDLAADVGALMQLIPEINHAFGLTPDQIEALHQKVVSTSPVGHTLQGAIPVDVQLT